MRRRGEATDNAAQKLYLENYIDRLAYHSVILELNIESYRMEVAKKNKRKKPDGPAKGSKSVGFE